MNISEAIQLMQSGNHMVARQAWGHRTFLYIEGDIIMLSRNGYAAPWVVPHPDLLANDWIEVLPHP